MSGTRSELEAVDWAALEVNGPAEVVPAAFRDIRSGDPDQRIQGYQRLSDVLMHQASASAGAVVAVPFLLDVLADPAAGDRFAACQVLLQIAIGEEEITLNVRPDFAAQRREAQRKAKLTVAELEAEQAAWVAEAVDPAERTAREVAAKYRDVEEDCEDQRVNAEAYDAVRAGVPVYIAALRVDDDPFLRAHAAQLLAYFPEDAAAIVPALIPLIDGEDPVVASAAAVAAGVCARGTGHAAVLEAITARRERAEYQDERWAMAIGLAQLLDDPGPEVMADVEEAGAAPEPVPYFPFLEGDIATLAAYTLDRIADRHTVPAGPWAS